MCFKNIITILIIIYVPVLTNSGRVKRVVGAVEVECGLQPNVASLRNSSTLKHLCGAVIVLPHIALTAAHCVLSKENQYFLQLNNKCLEETDTHLKIEIMEIIRHELYDPITRAHDLALLRLAHDENLANGTWSVLPESSFGVSGKCTIYGYGYRNHKKKTSEKLMAGALKIVSLDACEKALGPNVAPKYGDGMICAVGDGIDACQGDSGSPLICSRGTVEGISSYGMSCAVPGLPGVYTSVGAHLKWIQDNI